MRQLSVYNRLVLRHALVRLANVRPHVHFQVICNCVGDTDDLGVSDILDMSQSSPRRGRVSATRKSRRSSEGPHSPQSPQLLPTHITLSLHEDRLTAVDSGLNALDHVDALPLSQEHAGGGDSLAFASPTTTAPTDSPATQDEQSDALFGLA